MLVERWLAHRRQVAADVPGGCIFRVWSVSDPARGTIRASGGLTLFVCARIRE